MVLGALENLLDVNFSPDIDIDIDVLNFTNHEDGNQFQKDGRTLNLNLAALEPEKRREVLQLAPEEFEQQGRLLREEEAAETRAMETRFDDDMDEILDYFDVILSDRYLSIIDSSLYLRALIEERDLTKEEIQERKRDLARRHGYEAIYICSLVSAGYFDPDAGLRDLYVDMGLNEEYDRYNFQSVLSNLVENKILCYFVENDEEDDEATQAVRERLAKYQREEPINEWFDIRGIGDGCESVIDGIIGNLEEEYLGIDYDRWRDGDDLWVRIYPRSLPPIEQ